MKLYRFKAKKNKGGLLGKTIIGVGAVMVGLFLAFGSVIVTQQIFLEKVDFEDAPLPVENPDMSKRQRTLAQAQIKKVSAGVKRIQVQSPKQMAVQDVAISLPSSINNMSIDSVGDVGLAGVNLSGINIKIPAMDIFGTKATSDKVFIAFEASPQVMSDDMGAFAAYAIVKDEIKKLIAGLPGTTVFNVMAFDFNAGLRMHTGFKTLVPASPQNKEEFNKWIDTINSSPTKFGLSWNSPKRYLLKESVPPYPEKLINKYDNIDPRITKDNKITWHWDNVHRDQVVGHYSVYQAALESGAGAIWILTMSWPGPDSYIQSLDAATEKRYIEEYDRNLKAYEKGGNKIETQEDWNNWVKGLEPAKAKAKEWLENENKRRREKGIPERVVPDIMSIVVEQKIPYPQRKKPLHEVRPAVPKFKYYNRQSLYAAYEPIFKKYYDTKGMKRPKLNIIMLLSRKTEWDSKKSNEVNSWTRLNDEGISRVVKAGKPISEYDK